MGERIEFECRECGDDAAISNMDWLTSITGLDEEDLYYCDYHLEDALEGVVLDLSIGSSHTRSHDFEAQREARQQGSEAVERAKEREPVTFEAVYHDDEWDEQKAEIEMPSEANTDLKQLDWDRAHPKWNPERQKWTVDLKAVDAAVEHMEDNGWTVEVAPSVRRRAGE